MNWRPNFPSGGRTEGSSKVDALAALALTDESPVLHTENSILRLLPPGRADIMVRFRCDNREFLRPWEPARSEDFYTRPFWAAQLRRQLREYQAGTSLCLSILNPAQERVLGVCNFNQVVRGNFLACHLGYALDEREGGRGLMHEALAVALPFAFERLRLHRIMAGYMPRNRRSGAVLRRLGFRIEGYAERYLKINGRWEDHILTSRVVD